MTTEQLTVTIIITSWKNTVGRADKSIAKLKSREELD